MTRILGAVTVVIIAACVGCGGSGASADKNTLLANICSAIPDSVVTAVLGGKIVSRSSSGTSMDRNCIWDGKLNGPAGAHPQVWMSAYRATKAEFKLTAIEQDLRPVAGVNAAAYGGPEGDRGGWVEVWYRGLEVEINVVGVASPLPKAKRIANTVISRL